MKKINLMSSNKYSGCYDGDFDRWDIYIHANDAEPIPVNVSISQDGVAYWDCYLVGVKYLKRQNTYQLTYKEY